MRAATPPPYYGWRDYLSAAGWGLIFALSCSAIGHGLHEHWRTPAGCRGAAECQKPIPTVS